MNGVMNSTEVDPHPAAAARRTGPQRSNAVEPVTSDDIPALRAIVEGTAQNTGEEFFQNLVRHLAEAIDAHFAFVAEFAEVNTRVRTLAYWARDHLHDNQEWELAGTPCEEVVKGSLCHYPNGVKDQFTRDRPLAEMGIESYLGVPLIDPTGNHLGHLAVFDERPMPSEPRKLLIFRLFAARAAAELARLRLTRTLAESEQRYRDLYDEAPIAYVHEDLESRFISANQAALRILGLKPDEVAGTLGMSLVADTPDAQRRAREALACAGRGTPMDGALLELRRKDNGRPVWVRWWSNPDRGGKYTRTMLVDVTDRVLLEQEQARLQAQNYYLQEEIKSVHNFDEIIGRSPALTAVLDNVRRVAPTDASVLICGETGTGKELIARAVHYASKRKDKPLIKVNCAALPTGLVESELFGHEKGAFTGAIAKRIGRFELANGGTIFLDEIGDITAEAQAKLLRVLQEHECERVGGSVPIKVDVRIIAATNRDLLKAVREKTFREDLYYRLSVFPLHLPPLRERKEDIPLLVHFLMNKFASRIGKRVDGVSPATMQRLLAYPWPGNVRELENILERAFILANHPTLEIDADVLAAAETPVTAPVESAVEPDHAGSTTAAVAFPPLTLEAVERNHVVAVLRQTKWVISGPRGAAQALGMQPNTLRSRLKKLGISRSTHDIS
jgi:formate hydrogenlyase transcriptional activator